MIKKQVEFPLLDKYKQVFDITPQTIFAYGDDIYTDTPLTVDLAAHESTHLDQQEKVGLDLWVNLYLTDSNFRIAQETEAYKNQLKVFLDRNERYIMKLEFAKTLSSGLYGNCIEYSDALKRLC
jgi:hypothetical protein